MPKRLVSDALLSERLEELVQTMEIQNMYWSVERDRAALGRNRVKARVRNQEGFTLSASGATIYHALHAAYALAVAD